MGCERAHVTFASVIHAPPAAGPPTQPRACNVGTTEAVQRLPVFRGHTADLPYLRLIIQLSGAPHLRLIIQINEEFQHLRVSHGHA
eukprot:1158743-Pelagomonas_calceolata.AAC.11